MSPTPNASSSNDPLWYLRPADFGPDPHPEPPGSYITLAVYRVGPRGARVLVPHTGHRLCGGDPWWRQREPPCGCPLVDCPLKRRSA